VSTTLFFVMLFSFSNVALADSPLDMTIEELIGTSYKHGGTTKKGFDCSGFTQYVFKSFGIDLSHSSKSQAVEGTAVKKNELRKGDLVFFKTDGKGISHVGIFLGDGKFAHSSSKHGVIIDDISEAYYVKRYVTAARILSDETYQEITASQEE
jgi:murein DD-endopeptidase / murein LD-carboxypeptidase